MTDVSPEYTTKYYDPLKNVKVTPPIINKEYIQSQANSYYRWYICWVACFILSVVGFILLLTMSIPGISNGLFYVLVILGPLLIIGSGWLASSNYDDYKKEMSRLKN